MTGTYNEGTSYTVQTYIEVPTLDEAGEVAQHWIDTMGGEALVFKRTTRPWLRIVRVATYGSRR